MRHEKIVLVVLGYFIGFITAYIAYGLSSPVPDSEYKRNVPPVVEIIKDAPKEVEVIMADDGMFVQVDSRKVIVSGKLTEGVTEGPGFHVDIPRFEISPQGKYVYFCAQLSNRESVCNEYMYIVDEHLVKTLRAHGESLTSAVADSGFSWTSDELVTSNQYISASLEKPWELVPKQ